MRLCGIYIIKNITTNKVYVGQSVNIKTRFYIHKYELINNKHPNYHLQLAFTRDGERNFIFSILEICEKNNLDEKEIYYISLYNSYPGGYNLTSGGQKEYRVKQKKEGIDKRKECGKKLAEQTRIKRTTSKNKCLLCEKETESGYSRYCINHKKKCNNCGVRFNHETSTLCENCFLQSKTSFCKQCGKEIIKTNNSQKYCKECYKELEKARKREWKRNNKNEL